MCSAVDVSVPVWGAGTGWQMSGAQGVSLDSGAQSVGFGVPWGSGGKAHGHYGATHMAWNYETGQEELNPYSGGHGPQSTGFYKQGCQEILRWEEAEIAWREGWCPAQFLPRETWTKAAWGRVLATWEEAEMAVIGWDKRSEADNFRRGYITWLALSNGSSITLSDLDIDALPLLERIIAKGYRELAKTEHPDVGGSPERFAALREAKGQLDKVMEEVGDLLEEPEKRMYEH